MIGLFQFAAARASAAFQALEPVQPGPDAQTPREPKDPQFDPEMRNWRYHDTNGIGAWAHR